MLGLLLWNTWQAAWYGHQTELARRAADEATKKARDDFEALAARVHNLVEQASDGVFVADLEGRYTDVNGAACRMLGYAREELIGKNILDLVLPDEVPRFMQHKERLLRGEVEISEWIARKKDGTHFPVEVSAKILPDGQWQAFARDITERKRIETEQRFLSDAGAALSSTHGYEDTLQCIASLAVRGLADVCVIDGAAADGVLSRRKVASRDPSMKQSCDALERAPFDPSDLAPSALPARKPVIERDLTPETLASLAQGEAATEAWRAFDPKSMIVIPLSAHGKVVAVVNLLSHRMFQATDLRLAEDLGRRAATAVENALLDRELRQAIKGREDVLAIVSHDLGNPLTGILMAVKQLRAADIAKTNKLKEYTSAIETCADQMKRLIKDLLDFSKMQSGTFSVTKSAEKPEEVITLATDSVRMQADGRRQVLTLDVPATLPDIACDKHRIVQALSNLLGNAVKFTPEGGVIRVDARVRGAEFVISVSDTGPGIPSEYLPRIFDRYWQAEEAKGAGAGLGLAIAAGITEAHRGRIWAESRVRRGKRVQYRPALGPNT